jgi:hypothetical protein
MLYGLIVSFKMELDAHVGLLLARTIAHKKNVSNKANYSTRNIYT